MKLHVRTVGDPAPLLPMVRRTIERMDESLAIDASLLRDEIGIVFVMPRAGATLLSLFGLFGVITQYVNQRAQEIGVRVALGAQRREVVALIVRRGAHCSGRADWPAACDAGLAPTVQPPLWRKCARCVHARERR